jgi:plastocyanin
LLLPAVFVLQGAGTIGSKPFVVQTAAGITVALTVSNSLVFAPDAFPTAGETIIPPGSSVTVSITNLGTEPHTFTVSSLVNYTLPYLGNTNLTGTFLVTHPPFFSVNISEAQNSITTATFTAPTVGGSYQFFCTEPGHFGAGMTGVFGVGITVGPPPPPPGIGLPVFIIAGVIVGLVIMAIVLGFVVGKREGTKYEMPPERLGYSEAPPETPPGKPPQSPG